MSEEPMIETVSPDEWKAVVGRQAAIIADLERQLHEARAAPERIARLPRQCQESRMDEPVSYYEIRRIVIVPPEAKEDLAHQPGDPE